MTKFGNAGCERQLGVGEEARDADAPDPEMRGRFAGALADAPKAQMRGKVGRSD